MKHRFLALAVLFAACGDSEAGVGRAIYDAPSFALTAQSGESFESSALAGKVWVVHFFFTSCPSVCPVLTAKMQRLQADLAGLSGFHLVSFSVDPETDTPEVLTEYAQRHNADLRNWTFLTGETEAIREAVVEGLRVGIGERDARGDIRHGNYFVLVDQEGKVRGYYRPDDESQAQLREHVRELLE